jgi:hypothetical protein
MLSIVRDKAPLAQQETERTAFRDTTTDSHLQIT